MFKRRGLKCGFFVTEFFRVTVTFAGTASFQGYAVDSAVPDYVRVQVTVRSECYLKAGDAVKASDELANQVMGVLDTYRDPLHTEDQVTANGGFVERYTNTDPQTHRLYCINAFRKTNIVILKTSKVAGFATAFAQLQDSLYGLGHDEPSGLADAPNTYLLIDAPATSLYRSHFDQIKLQTTAEALSNAIDKFKATFAVSGIDKFLIKSYVEIGGSQGSMDKSADYARAPTEAPLRFDGISVDSSVQADFEF